MPFQQRRRTIEKSNQRASEDGLTGCYKGEATGERPPFASLPHKEINVTLRTAMVSVVLGGVLATAPVAVLAQRADHPVSITTKTTYPAGSVDAASWLDWIAGRSPAHAPVSRRGTVQVLTTRAGLTGSSVARAPSAGPPTPLPNGGNQGDGMTVTSRDAAVSTETWGYTFHNGAWTLVEYHYRSVTVGKEDAPENPGG
ncbi:hypothetical protein [Stenotrophomonas sp.]|uniref:hypothetical protein n=1 Tax=Stenotrophomonas sp. TaxID=69392 RepID=UPI0028AA5857|nr:hypothetical protein [Stenotrophomonas sp.]